MKSKPHSIAVLTVAFNRTDALAVCLRALNKNTHRNLFDIFVIDNGSVEDVQTVAAQNKASYLRLAKNYFISRALNEGFKHFNIEDSYEYIVVTGSDVLTDPRTIHELYTLMEHDKSIGISGPSHYQIHTNVLLTRGLSIHPVTSLLVNTKRIGEQKPINHFHSLYIVRSDLFGSAGGLNHVLFPMIFEEPDLGERALRLGFKIVPCPKAKIWHPIDQPPPQNKTEKMRIPRERLYNSTPKAYLFFRNRIIYMTIYSTPLRLLTFFLVFNPIIFFYYLFDVSPQYIPYVLRGLCDGIIFAATKNVAFIKNRNREVLHV